MASANSVEARVLAAGDCAWSVEFGEGISRQLSELVYRLAELLSREDLPGLGELVPSYRALLVHYEPLTLDGERLRRHLQCLVREVTASGEAHLPTGRLRRIPTVYGGEFGPDLEVVAELAGLSTAEVVQLHSSVDYHTYMIGFMPGFPYLGGLPKELHLPRLTTPRLRVPAGSVAIAVEQAGIYPVESPGGWYLLGRTPYRLFDVRRDNPSYIEPGDSVRFVPIDAANYDFAAEEQPWD